MRLNMIGATRWLTGIYVVVVAPDRPHYTLS